jgi:hypothetical protein
VVNAFVWTKEAEWVTKGVLLSGEITEGMIRHNQVECYDQTVMPGC